MHHNRASVEKELEFFPEDSIDFKTNKVDTSKLAATAKAMGTKSIEPNKMRLQIPSEIDAYFIISKNGFNYFVSEILIGFVPPASKKIENATINLNFDKVGKIGAWEPNDVFTSYRQKSTVAKINVNYSPKIPDHLLPIISDLLLPQISAEYQRESSTIKTPKDSVIRSSSDGQKELLFEYFIDKKTEVDPRQAELRILYGFRQNVKLQQVEKLLTLDIFCKSGTFRTIRELSEVAIYFHN